MPDTGPVGMRWRSTTRRIWNGSTNISAAKRRNGRQKPFYAMPSLTRKPANATKTNAENRNQMRDRTRIETWERRHPCLLELGCKSISENRSFQLLNQAGRDACAPRKVIEDRLR